VAIKESVKTSAYKANSGKWAPAHYCGTLPVPGVGDWDLTGPDKDIFRGKFGQRGRGNKIKAKMNFSQDTWPYWNNAHHLIPKGTLKAKIVAEGTRVSEVMQKALLLAKYNVNHKVNMLFLPQDKEVARILTLTRHIQLKERDVPGTQSICTDHPIYNRLVEDQLVAIIQEYKTICDQEIAKAKPHKIPDAEVNKKQLERLSRRLLKMILAWGEVAEGASLDALADTGYAGL
jgi:hypothetical protein